MNRPLQLPQAIQNDLAKVEALIRQKSDSDRVDRINDVLHHIFSGGGKRFRPILTLCASRLLGYEGAKHRYLAAAVEFVHTATLVHDDVVDDSRQRRGRPAANFLWDNKTSVLVGDYLFARSFQLMVASGSLRALEVLSDASSTIAEAEVLQLVKQNDPTMSLDTYLTIIRGKTAALFSAATSAGTIVAEGSEKQIRSSHDFGEALGIGFQIMDDLLDYQGASSALGKNVGDDFRDGKVTLPVIYALEEADEEERKFWLRVFKHKQLLDGDLEEGMSILNKRGIVARVENEAVIWSERSKKHLAHFPDGEIKEFMHQLADYSVQRSS